MNTKLKTSSLLMALPTFFAATVFAQQQNFQVDPSASSVAFTLGDVLHSVHGTFHVQSGAIDFDRTASKISGTVVVSAGSGESGNDTRDRKMSKDILDAPHFADASFAPRSYTGTINPAGDSTIQVTGVFTLHGTPHDITVPMKLHMEGANCTAKSQFPVPYVKWGLKDPSTFMLHVAKEVQIELTLIGHVSPTG